MLWTVGFYKHVSILGKLDSMGNFQHEFLSVSGNNLQTTFTVGIQGFSLPHLWNYDMNMCICARKSKNHNCGENIYLESSSIGGRFNFTLIK